MLQDPLEEALVVVLRYSSTRGARSRDDKQTTRSVTGCGTKPTRRHSHFPWGTGADFTENANVNACCPHLLVCEIIYRERNVSRPVPVVEIDCRTCILCYVSFLSQAPSMEKIQRYDEALCWPNIRINHSRRGTANHTCIEYV